MTHITLLWIYVSSFSQLMEIIGVNKPTLKTLFFYSVKKNLLQLNIISQSHFNVFIFYNFPFHSYVLSVFILNLLHARLKNRVMLQRYNQVTNYFSTSFTNYCCKDQFRLRSNTGMDPGPRSPNNEFVE